MLKLEEIEGEDALYVVSDDANTENAALAEAIEDAAPHLLVEFNNTDVEDGVLKWRVARADYSSLLEVMDVVEGVDPEEWEAISEMLEAKTKEVVGE
jgi:hypothetical protein